MLAILIFKKYHTEGTLIIFQATVNYQVPYMPTIQDIV